MLTQKTFLRKTKRGNILKIVREHYLRDDIGCGCTLCGQCDDHVRPLQKDFVSHSNLLKKHYIVPDTNVVLHQIDVLRDDAFTNVIIPQTVIQELRHRHAPAYNTIREILANKDRHFYCFVNEHHKDTYVERVAGESSNDRNDRAIRRVVSWLRNHLQKQDIDIEVTLLSDDKACVQLAKDEGLPAFRVREYVESMNIPQLLDKVAQLNNEGQTESDPVGNKKFMYPEHLSQSVVQDGIKEGKYHLGKFRSSRENYLEGYVSIGNDNDDEEDSKSILIQGLMHLNRAVQDDTVVVEIFEESEWAFPSSVVLEDAPVEDDKIEEEDDDGEKEQKVEKVLKESKTEKGLSKMPTGRIVGIMRRKWRPYCGILAPSAIKEATKHLFIPAEKRIPKIRIETRQAKTLQGQRIIVAIDSWPRNSRYPLGHYVRTLGQIGDRKTENEVLLLEHDVPHQPFSQAVLNCLPKLPWVITKEDESKRVDLRSYPICSVDPVGCTDIDDALHAIYLPNGNIEVGVHIADVSHFIRPGTAIDKEAADRGTTVYLVDQRIDMVPGLLSSNLCSLRGGEERFAFSAVWEMTPDAKVLSTKYHKSIIKSKAALTYAEAQAKIDDKTQDDETSIGLRLLNTLAKKMKARRIENGALSLASSEVRFQVDSETHDPIDVKSKQLL